jgi:hypothetical protein
MDLCGPFEPSGPLKYRYIAVAVDSLTKFVEMKPLVGSPKMGVDPEEVANFVQNEVFHRYAGVFEVVTDRGPDFFVLVFCCMQKLGRDSCSYFSQKPSGKWAG